MSEDRLASAPEALRRAVLASDVGQVIVRARAAAGMRQAELGDRIGGYGQSTISRIESGRTKNPPPALLRRIAEALSIPVEWVGMASGPTTPSTRREPVSRPEFAAGLLQATTKVDMRTVEQLELCIEDYWDRDDRMGGEMLQPAVEGHLQMAVRLLKHATVPSLIRLRMLGATAELARLSGWMLFDCRHYANAGNNYQRAAEIAQEAKDAPYTANVLASMSLRATYDDTPQVAVGLAETAEDVARTEATPRVRAMLAMRTAFAHAAAGDTPSGHAAIARSERLLDRAGDGDEDPPWCRYFDEVKLLADAGIARARLGEHAVGADLISAGLGRQDVRNARLRAFHSLWLAKSHLAMGDLDQACDDATEAATTIRHVRSPRVEWHLLEFRDAVRSRAHEPVARRFVDAMRSAYVD